LSGSVGVCAQGFLRRAAADGRVSIMLPNDWDALPVLRHARVLFLSEEDLGGGASPAVPAAWLAAVPITVLTAGRRGAQVWSDGRRHSIPACPAAEVDPTGAGDSFAAAYMIALDEGADPVEAAHFAAAVAAFVVEAPGPQAPTRAAVAARQGLRTEDSGLTSARQPDPGTQSSVLSPQSSP
jgi:sugar/nucleoside kinase (ribokinase family)